MKSKRILLVFPDVSYDSLHRGYFHYGLASISAYLKDRIKGIDVTLLHIRDKHFNQGHFREKIRESLPHIIAFTSTTHSFLLVQQYAKWVKDLDDEILTVCGGVHVTLNPEEALTSSALDAVVRGDGEYPMEALVNEWIANKRIPNEKGIWYRKNGKIIDNGCTVVADLDSLPDSDWQLFDYMNLSAPKQGLGGIMLSRGCPYHCSYCCNRKLANIYKSSQASYIRFKSVERSISEIKNFIGKFPTIDTLYFDDDILPLKQKWFFEFAREYKKEINKPYWCNIRPNLVNSKIVEALVNSGCTRVGIGIETGNEGIRSEILKRGLSDKTIIDKVSLLKERGVYVYSFNMVGLPRERKAELLDTIRMNANLGIDKIQCTVFYPYRYTDIYDLCVQDGLLVHSKWLIEYHRETTLEFDYAQRNRIYFTELTINLVAKLYAKSPKYLAEFFLGTLYSHPSAILFLPILNILLRTVLASGTIALGIKKIYRLIIPLPSTGRSEK